MVRGKFQVKYLLKIDRELTSEKAKGQGLSSEFGGGRPTKGGLKPGGQFTLRFRNGATVLVGPKGAQVFWSGDYDDIGDIERLLNGVVVFLGDEKRRFDPSTRENVPTISFCKKEIAEVKADLAKVLNHQEWMAEVARTMERTSLIRDRKVSNHLFVNRRYYLEAAQVMAQKLNKLYDEGVKNGWVRDDSIKSEAARLKKIVDSGGHL